MAAAVAVEVEVRGNSPSGGVVSCAHDGQLFFYVVQMDYSGANTIFFGFIKKSWANGTSSVLCFLT